MKRIPVRFWDFPSVAFLVIAQMVVCQRLFVTGWTPGLELGTLLAFFGVVLGLALGFSRFKPGTVLLLALGYSLALIPLSAGTLMNDRTAWLERLTNLLGRLLHSTGLFMARQPVTDTILFVAFISVMFWIISLTAGYALTRAGNFLWAVLPGGVALFLIQFYDGGSLARVAFLAVYIFLCLLLLGRLTYIRKRRFWKEQRVWISTESVTDINLSILIVSVVLIFATWLAPSSSQPIVVMERIWDSLAKPFENTRKNLGNAVAGLQGKAAASGAVFYTADLALGGQAASGTTLVFTVRLPYNQSVAHYYWRVRTYDQYLNDSWHTTATSERSFSPAHALNAANSRGLATSEFVFTFPEQNITTLITPSRPVWVSRPAILTYLPAQNGEVEPVLFQVNPPLQAGQSYKVHALVYNPTILLLSQAGTDYPAWVTNHYLQLPPDLPPAIADLARQITELAETPYDKAQAVTEYLRNNIQYTKVVPPTPPGQEALAWFLFDYQAGFCNYYASAEVVMLRTLGIPARLAVGYSGGVYQPPDKRTVREEDAHAWPEVYFPGIGWVEFEPTTSQLPLDRPSGILPFETGPKDTTPQPGVEKPPVQPDDTASLASGSRGPGVTQNPITRLAIILAVLIVIIVAGWLILTYGSRFRILRRFQHFLRKPVPVFAVELLERLSLTSPGWLERWAHRARLTPVERSFGIVFRSLRWLGAEAGPAQTPAEAASRLSVLVPAAVPDIRLLLEMYQGVVYSQEPGDRPAARHAAGSIRRHSLRTAIRSRLAALRHFFRMVQ